MFCMASDDAALLGEAGGCGPSAARLCAVFGDGGAGGLPVQEAACFIETAVSPGRPARRVAPSVGFAATSPEVFPSGEERWASRVSPAPKSGRPEEKLR